MTMDVQCDIMYESCGCNRTPHAADWGYSNKICFASCDSIAIFNPHEYETSQIDSINRLHKNRVTSVRWLRNNLGKFVSSFVSSSIDKTAILTYLTNNGSYSAEAVLIGHENAVSVVDGVYLSDVTEYSANSSPVVIVTASDDSTIKLWHRLEENGAIECADTINLNSGFALDVKLAVISNSVIVAAATDDRKIHLFTQNDKGTYRKIHSISGHEDWVRALDFCYYKNKVLLATGSQDTFVRVYELTLKQTNSSQTISNGSTIFETEETELCVGNKQVALRLDTVLMGHENWVYGVSFYVSSSEEVFLLTSSMDKSLVLWTFRDSLWIEIARVGEVGGNTLGFFGGKLSPDGQSIMAHGYQGSFHLWRCTKEELWEPEVPAGGHLGPVRDLCWSPSGAYLLSVGEDQTTRLIAKWRHNGKESWHEIARPQVHGHDMSCISALSDTSFVSGAEEKVLRAFRAPKNFLDNFYRISQTQLNDSSQDSAPEGASVPSLGLSNKPVYHDESNAQTDPDSCFTPIQLTRPPTEENLVQNTLWPEIQKLYKHGYEVHCVAATLDGSLIASACHSSNVEHASVVLWDTKTWTVVQQLPYHRLTVTQMEFSPDGLQLLTVSRDRRWCLYRKDSESGLYATQHTAETSAHKRIIWCCAWNPTGSCFATGSRDGVVCLWDAESGKCLFETNVKQSVTSLSFSADATQTIPVLLVGTESGSIVCFTHIDGNLLQVKEFQMHSKTITRIRSRPAAHLEFASSSEDFSVKIFRISSLR